jgi:hypothetical protein
MKIDIIKRVETKGFTPRRYMVGKITSRNIGPRVKTTLKDLPITTVSLPNGVVAEYLLSMHVNQYIPERLQWDFHYYFAKIEEELPILNHGFAYPIDKVAEFLRLHQ